MKRFLWLGSFLVVFLVFATVGVGAQSSNSTNFRLDESFIGPGGNLDSTSTNYKTESGQQTLGGAGGGEATSANFSTKQGSPTTPDPTLACSVTSPSINFGAFSVAGTATGTSTFSVLNYTSSGYTVQILGSPPSTAGGSYTLAGMSSTTTSQVGTEQFGINLVANTSPTTFGASPVQVPSSSFSFGAASANYGTANNFRYVAGETIAAATKTSGETAYTISYIINTSNQTAGGTYSTSQTLVCIGTF